MLKTRLMATTSRLPLIVVGAEMDREAQKRAPAVVLPIPGRA